MLQFYSNPITENLGYTNAYSHVYKQARVTVDFHLVFKNAGIRFIQKRQKLLTDYSFFYKKELK